MVVGEFEKRMWITSNRKEMNYLDELENEAIYIMREVAAQFEKPVLLFSGGKDSITLVHLAIKAFYPAKVPFPLMHIDTGHNFPETIEFRDELAKKHGLNLIVRYVEDSINQGKQQKKQENMRVEMLYKQ